MKKPTTILIFGILLFSIGCISNTGTQRGGNEDDDSEFNKCLEEAYTITSNPKITPNFFMITFKESVPHESALEIINNYTEISLRTDMYPRQPTITAIVTSDSPEQVYCKLKTEEGVLRINFNEMIENKPVTVVSGGL